MSGTMMDQDLKEKVNVNKVLIVIDVQNDFVTGSLGSEVAVKTVPTIRKYVKQFEEEGCSIIFTKDIHYDGQYESSQEGRLLPVKHCIEDTEGAEIVDGLINEDMLRDRREVIISKNTFGYMNWEHYWFPEEIEICIVGFCTDICVIANALLLKTYFPENKITVLKDGCAGTTLERHEAALDVMRSCQIFVE